MSRRLLHAACALALAGGVAFGGVTAASASDGFLDLTRVHKLTIGGVNGDEVLALSVDRLYPGAPAAVARFQLKRGSGFIGGDFAYSLVNVVDLERDCNRSELISGDDTCGGGDDQGELSDQLLVGQTWAPAGACATADMPTKGVAMSAREGAVVAAPALLSDDDVVCLVLALKLPLDADNLVQGDLVRFDLRLALQDATPSMAVMGVREDKPFDSPGISASSGASMLGLDQPSILPHTGAQLIALALWAAAAVSLGVVLHRASRPSHRF